MVLKFSASSATRLMNCPGAANLEAAIPGYVAPVVDETAGAKGVGTEIHDALHNLLTTLSLPEMGDAIIILQDYAELHHTKRKACRNNIDKMWEWFDDTYAFQTTGNVLNRVRQLDFAPRHLKFIKKCLDYIYDLLDAQEVVSHGSEVKLTATWLPSCPNTTVDYYIQTDDTLYVIDFKTGSIPVYAQDNDQLLFYAAALENHLSNPQLVTPTFTEIELIILQPDNNNDALVSLRELSEWRARAIAADIRIRKGDLTLKPNDGCTFCPANPRSRGDKGKPSCPALMDLYYPRSMDYDAVLDL